MLAIDIHKKITSDLKSNNDELVLVACKCVLDIEHNSLINTKRKERYEYYLQERKEIINEIKKHKR